MTVLQVADREWVEDPNTGVLKPPWEIRKFIAWYIRPDKPRTMQWIPEYAEVRGVSVKRIRSWLKDPRVLAALDEACVQVNLRPDRIQAVVDAVWEKATRGDIKAAELYLKYAGRLLPQPKAVNVTVTHSVKDLSDEQLQAELQRLHRALPAPTIDAEVVEDGSVRTSEDRRSDAVQEPEAAQVDARKRASNGKAVGEAHSEGKGASEEGA